MATTVHEPPKISSRPDLQDGGGNHRPPVTASLRAVDDTSPASRTGIWVGLAAITMTFAALTSAMVVRQASSYDWQHFVLPSILYFNTAVLLASSAALEVARKRVAAFVHGDSERRSAASLWLWLTMGLGLLFVAGQYEAWLQLRAQGVYLASSPSSSFFYLFTTVHVVHVLGGLGGLTLVIWRFSKRRPTLHISTLSTVSYYWHFMGILWIYLLLLLWMRI